MRFPAFPNFIIILRSGDFWRSLSVVGHCLFTSKIRWDKESQAEGKEIQADVFGWNLTWSLLHFWKSHSVFLIFSRAPRTQDRYLLRRKEEGKKKKLDLFYFARSSHFGLLPTCLNSVRKKRQNRINLGKGKYISIARISQTRTALKSCRVSGVFTQEVSMTSPVCLDLQVVSPASTFPAHLT